jgi:hypothetical protein
MPRKSKNKNQAHEIGADVFKKMNHSNEKDSNTDYMTNDKNESSELEMNFSSEMAPLN